MSSSIRVRELDALRGLAALAVVLYHYTSRFDRIYGYPGGSPMEFYFGRFGVELFFMISGFVIFMTLSTTRTGIRGCGDFALSRFSRLYPAFWAAMGITFLAMTICELPGRSVSPGDLLGNATMLPGLFRVPMVDGVYWTLEKELIFYFWMAVLLLFDGIRRIRPVLLVWLLFSLLAVLAHQAIGPEESLAFKIFENALILKWIPYFCTGMVAYLRRSQGILTKLDFVIMSIVAARVSFDHNLFDTVIIMAFVLVFYFMARGWLAWLAFQPLLFLGTISYTLYLVHQNIGYIIIIETLPLLHRPWLAWLLAITISIVLAAAITFAVERPAMSAVRLWKQRLGMPL